MHFSVTKCARLNVLGNIKSHLLIKHSCINELCIINIGSFGLIGRKRAQKNTGFKISHKCVQQCNM